MIDLSVLHDFRQLGVRADARKSLRSIHDLVESWWLNG